MWFAENKKGRFTARKSPPPFRRICRYVSCHLLWAIIILKEPFAIPKDSLFTGTPRQMKWHFFRWNLMIKVINTWRNVRISWAPNWRVRRETQRLSHQKYFQLEQNQNWPHLTMTNGRKPGTIHGLLLRLQSNFLACLFPTIARIIPDFIKFLPPIAHCHNKWAPTELRSTRRRNLLASIRICDK